MRGRERRQVVAVFPDERESRVASRKRNARAIAVLADGRHTARYRIERRRRVVAGMTYKKAKASRQAVLAPVSIFLPWPTMMRSKSQRAM